jgi:hypothetical protein
MARLRSLFIGLVLGTALVPHTAVAQSSSSLTHVVSVTVPPRVKVQVSNAVQAAQSAVRVSSAQTSSNGLSLSISATRAWTLSVGSVAKKSHVQWSYDPNSGFAKMGGNDATVASGTISQVPTRATVFFRNAAVSDLGGTEGSDAVMLTVVAQ